MFSSLFKQLQIIMENVIFLRVLWFFLARKNRRLIPFLFTFIGCRGG